MEVGMVSERWARGLARSILLLLERRQGHPGAGVAIGCGSHLCSLGVGCSRAATTRALGRILCQAPRYAALKHAARRRREA